MEIGNGQETMDDRQWTNRQWTIGNGRWRWAMDSAPRSFTPLPISACRLQIADGRSSIANCQWVCHCPLPISHCRLVHASDSGFHWRVPEKYRRVVAGDDPIDGAGERHHPALGGEVGGG